MSDRHLLQTRIHSPPDLGNQRIVTKTTLVCSALSNGVLTVPKTV